MGGSEQAPSAKVRARAAELTEELHAANRAYYLEGGSPISDAQYDAWFRELLALERDYPVLRGPDSPTQRVGAPLPEGTSFAKVAHAVPMLSIESLFEAEQVRDFEGKIRRFLNVPEDELLAFSVEPKFDGVSAALIYEDGELVRGLTRGDGQVGEDILANLRTVRNIPLRLKGDPGDLPSLLEVRGEVLIARDRFEEFNQRRAEEGLPLLANARNATSGALRRNDPAEVARYPLEFYSYSAPRVEGGSVQPETQSALFEALTAWGLPMSGYQEVAQGIEACLQYHARIEAARDEIPFEMDGIVAKLDRFDLRQRLGRTARATRWQYAHKFAPREEISTLLAIEVQVGAKGRLTPRAHVAPVNVGGVVVRHTTLHNEDNVQKLNLHPGDRVFLKRAGDVIPQITGVAQAAQGSAPDDWEERRPESLLDAEGSLRPGVIAEYGQAFAMPDECPACGTPVVRSGKYVTCPNVRGCLPQRMGRTIHFAARAGIEIESIGEKGVAQLFEAGLISDPADLFTLQEEDLLQLDRWGEKSAQNLVRELEQRKSIPFGKFLASLAIPGLGETVGDLLAGHFASWDDLVQADAETLEHIDGLGPKTTAQVLAWFADEQNLEMVERMWAAGVKLVYPSAQDSGALQDKRVVFTGTLEHTTRAEAKKLVEEAGGKVSSSVSSKTHVLVQGGKPGSKAKKAEELGLEVWDEATFRARLGLPPVDA